MTKRINYDDQKLQLGSFIEFNVTLFPFDDKEKYCNKSTLSFLSVTYSCLRVHS